MTVYAPLCRQQTGGGKDSMWWRGEEAEGVKTVPLRHWCRRLKSYLFHHLNPLNRLAPDSTELNLQGKIFFLSGFMPCWVNLNFWELLCHTVNVRHGGRRVLMVILLIAVVNFQCRHGQQPALRCIDIKCGDNSARFRTIRPWRHSQCFARGEWFNQMNKGAYR